jgi:hypothetical protein
MVSSGTELPPYPLVLEVRAVDAASGLSYSALSTPLADLDLLYRVAAGTYGTSLTRMQRPTWPAPRPSFLSLGYGSPFEVTLLVDLQTLLVGAGFGTGVVGMSALLRWVFGLDLDLRARRAEGYAQIARHHAEEAEAEARAGEANVRTLRAAHEHRILSAVREATDVDASRDVAPPPVARMPVAREAVQPRRPHADITDPQVGRIDRVVRGGRIRRSDEVLQSLTHRLLAMRRRRSLLAEAKGVVRDPTATELELRHLPPNGDPPPLPDVRRQRLNRQGLP